MTDQNKVLPLPVDEYTGVGGDYVIDENGKRSPAETSQVLNTQPTGE